MPANENGSLRQFTADEIAAMQIETFDVRSGNHPTETRRMDENTMTRTFLVKWDKRYDFVELCVGNAVLWVDDDPGPAVTKLSRQLPEPLYGRHPEKPQIIATRIESIRGHGVGRDDATTKMPAYPKAIVEVFYEQFKGVVRSDAGLTQEVERFVTRGPGTTDVEAFTLPGAAFKYTTPTGTGAHGKPVPFNVSFSRPVRRFNITWHNLPNALYTTDGALFRRLYLGTGDGIPWLGTVNSADIEFTGLGNYAAGQLLLEGVEDRQYASGLVENGVAGLRWDVTFKYAYTPRGWLDLFFFDAGTPANSGYYRISNNGTHYAVGAMPDNTGLYNVRAFAELFNPHLA